MLLGVLDDVAWPVCHEDRTRRPTDSLAARARGLIGILPALGLAILGLALLAPLAADATLGRFARYTADDYCTAGAERAAGYLGAQVFWYQTWSGRFTYYATVSLVELAGPAVAQVLPAIALAAWVAVGAWAVHRLARAEGWPAPWLSAAVTSAAVVFVCVSGAPDLDQVLFWQTGMLTYLFPLILLTAFLGWLSRWIWAWPPRRWSARGLALVGVFLFLSAGVSETTLALQCALVGLAAALSVLGVHVLHVGRLRATPAPLAVGLVATGLAAVVVVAAPGNAAHEVSLTGSTHPLSELPRAVLASVDFVGLFARSIEFRARPGVLILLAVSAFLGWQHAAGATPGPAGRGLVRYALGLGVVVACAWVLLIAATTPGYFAQGWDPPERAQFVGVWVLTLGVAMAAYVAARGVRAAIHQSRPFEHLGLPAVAGLWPVCAVALAVAPILATRTVLAEVPSEAAYAQQWDALDMTMRSMAAAGQPVVLERSLPRHFGFDFVGPDPGVYPNPCVAQFYGVPSIRVST